MSPPRPKRWRLTRLVAGVTLGGLALIAGARAPALSPLRVRGAVWALARLPVARTCEDAVGRLSSLAHGVADPCPGSAIGSPETAAIAARVAADRRRPVRTRAGALRAMAATPWRRDGLERGILAGPSTAPGMRRAALAALGGAHGGVSWMEDARAVAAHDLYEEATLRLFAEGEPGLLRAAARALRASRRHSARSGIPHVLRGLGIDVAALGQAVALAHEGRTPAMVPDAWVPVLRAHTCEDDCVPLLLALLEAEARAVHEEPGPSVAELARHDRILELLEPRDPELAQHLRDEIVAVEAWVGRFTPEARPARIVSALLHPEGAAATPTDAPWELGDLHLSLARAAGAPGATALLLDEVAGATGVPLTLWATPTGLGARVGDRTRALEGCSAAQPSNGPYEGWVIVPRGGAAALALGEAAVRSLREGHGENALAQLEAARTAWPAAPGLAELGIAVRAWMGVTLGDVAGQEAPGVQGAWGSGRQGPGTVFVLTGPPAPAPRRRGRRRKAPPPPRDDRPDLRAAEIGLASSLREAAPTPDVLASAAYWAAAGGNDDLARLLLPPPGGDHDDVRAAAAFLAGEPVGPVGPVSADAAWEPWTGAPASCPPAWSAAPAARRPRP